MAGPIVREYDKRIWKKCIKCRGWHPRADIIDDATGEVIRKHGFGAHADSSDGLQSICFFCKNAANNLARTMNVKARIRHHTSTRCLTQLGKAQTPREFVKNLEDYLGYKIATLVKSLSKDLKEREGPKRKLRDALNEGYHIDHKKPLSTFKVLHVTEPDGHKDVDWTEFRKCWAISNLRAISADENLAKGANYDESEPNADNEAVPGPGSDVPVTADAEDNDGQTQSEEGEAKEAPKTQIDISAETKD